VPVLVLVLVRKALAAATIVVAASLALGGCTGSPAPTSTATPKPAKTSALTGLLPSYPAKFTAASAKSETVAAADNIQALVAKTDILYVDDHAELVPATKSAASYYGVLRTINVAPALDPLEQAEAMERLLVAAGWTERDSANQKGKYLAALTSNPTGSRAWFLLVGGDSTKPKSPVVTIQLASPDLAAG
jgi:hypothetical protein